MYIYIYTHVYIALFLDSLEVPQMEVPQIHHSSPDSPGFVVMFDFLKGQPTMTGESMVLLLRGNPNQQIPDKQHQYSPAI